MILNDEMQFDGYILPDHGIFKLERDHFRDLSINSIFMNPVNLESDKVDLTWFFPEANDQLKIRYHYPTECLNKSRITRQNLTRKINIRKIVQAFFFYSYAFPSVNYRSIIDD